ncbi:MAG: transcription elongation factor [Opitutaceae bacterium]|nr:transcription elongation factor [Opitutaceae bacterium]
MTGSELKSRLRQLIIRQLQADHELQVRAAQLAHDEAISEESRPENKYDTHSQEAAYLAEGQAKLAAEAAAAISAYQALPLPDFDDAAPLAIGALLRLSATGRTDWYLLGPLSGGLEIALPDHGDVCVLTPLSPLGRQLIGKHVGDNVTLPGSGATATISKVC